MDLARQKRIRTWYSPEGYSALAEEFHRHQTALLEEGDRPTRSWDPDALQEWATGLLDSRSLPLTEFLERIQPLYSRRSMGHQVAPPLPIGALWDGLGALINQGAGLFEMSPASSAAEWAVLAKLRSLIPWPEGDGFFTSGGTLANLTALLAARNHRFPQAWEQGVPPNGVLVAGADAHYSVSRAAGVLGLGTERVIRVPLDARRRLCPKALDQVLGDLGDKQPFAVVATSGSTAVGAFDSLGEIAAVCRRHGVWLHVDGAHGASVLFSQAHRGLVDGLEEADSLVWDAHKLLHMPALSTAVLFRHGPHSWKAFHQEAPYMFDPEGIAPQYDGAQRTFECTRRALAVPLWGTLALAGEGLFEDMVDQLFAVTRRFHDLLVEDPDFEPFLEPQGNILCFSFRGFPDSKALRRKVLKAGQYYLTQTVVDSRSLLRVALMNPLVDEQDLLGLMAEIRGLGQGENGTGSEV